MTCGVAQVESLANAMLMRVFLHYTLLHLYTLSHHALQLPEVRVHKVEVYKLCPHGCIVSLGSLRNRESLTQYKTMFQHLCIAGCNVLVVESL